MLSAADVSGALKIKTISKKLMTFIIDLFDRYIIFQVIQWSTDNNQCGPHWVWKDIQSVVLEAIQSQWLEVIWAVTH